MTTNLGPWPGNLYPPVRAHATANITPFTYYDGLSFLEVLEALRAWLRETLIPGLDGVIEIVDGMIQDALENVAVDLAVMRQELDDALASIELTDTELRAYVDDVLQQVINNSIELQDAVLAGIVKDSASESRDELDKLYVAKDSLVYVTSDHGVIGNGVTDDTDTMQALINSVPDGSTIISPVGSTFRTNGWRIDQKSVTLDLSNSHVIRTGDAPIVYADGEYELQQNVYEESTIALTVPDASLYKRGDVLKVVSDDIVWDARIDAEDAAIGLAPRQGQFVTVESASGTAVNLSSRLIDTYTTNVRVARLVKSHRVSVSVGTCERSDTATSVAMFYFTSLFQPSITANILANNGTGVAMWSNYNARANITVDNLPEGNGYGLTTRASAYGEYHIVARTCRHAFTDGVARDLPVNEPDFMRYGRPMFETITGSSQGTLQSSWDTHHGGYGHKFLNITAVGAMGSSGTSSAPAVFALRGRYHQMINCTAIGGAPAFRIMAERNEPWAVSENHRIVNCVSMDSTQPFEITLNDKMPADRGVNVTIEGGQFESTRRYFIYQRSARVRVNGPQFRFTGAELGGTTTLVSHGGDLRGSMTLTALGLTRSPDMVVQSLSSDGAYDIVDLDLTLELSRVALDGTATLWDARYAMGEIRARVNANTGMSWIRNALAPAADQGARLDTVRGAGVTDGGSSSRSITVTNGRELNSARSTSPVIILRLWTSSDVTVGAIDRGAYSGQLMVLVNAAGSNTITIPNGGEFNTTLGGGMTIAGNRSQTLIYDGKSLTWRRTM